MQKVLSFSSDLQHLNIADQIVDTISVQKKLSTDLYVNILLSLTEAINNAIVHGNKFNSKKKVTVTFQVDNSKKLIITVEDEGNGFNPETIPDPTDPDNINKLHGRGIFLIQHLADEVNYLSKGKIIEMKFNLL